LQDPQMPFFIDWLESPHPALSTPTGCTLEQFSISTAEPSIYQGFLDSLGLPLEATSGPEGFTAQLNTPKGAVTLEAW